MSWTECLCPPRSYVETLSVMAFGGGAFGGRSRLDEVMGVWPRNGIRVLIVRERDQSPLSLTISRSREDTVRKGIGKPGRGLLPGAGSASAQSWTLQPPEP